MHPAFHDIVHSLNHCKEKIAIIDKDGRQINYDELNQLISGTRLKLHEKQITKGKRVLIFVPMSIELYAILEAVFSVGATAVFLDPWMKGKKMHQVIKQIKPDLFIVTKKINRLVWILPSTWSLRKWKISTLEKSNSTWIPEEVSDTDTALITFTSGTSGIPKGADRTFEFIHAQLKILKTHLPEHSIGEAKELTNFPVVALATLAMGNTIVIPNINLMKIHEANSDLLIHQLKKHEVNRLIVSPSLLQRIVQHNDINQLKKLQHIITGGAPISITLIKKCLDNFPNINLESIYGSTESEPIATCNFKDIIQNFDTPLNGVYVGKIDPETKCKIIKITNQAIEPENLDEYILDNQEIGEVIVTGAHVNKNYFENVEAFKKNKIVNDSEIWHRTGDIGYLKNDILYLVGRDHRVMERDGKKFYPYPIEQLIEKEFALTDIGYVQNNKGEFILFIGSTFEKIDEKKITDTILKSGYSLTKIIVLSKPLPRDARHKSKLQIEDLI